VSSARALAGTAFPAWQAPTITAYSSKHKLVLGAGPEEWAGTRPGLKVEGAHHSQAGSCSEQEEARLWGSATAHSAEAMLLA
jgi:hypothetical protein